MEDAHSLTPDQAQAAIRQLPLDDAMTAALRDPSHAGHAAANAYRRDLYAVAHSAVETKAPAESGEDAPPQIPDGPAADDAHFAAPAGPEDYRFDAVPTALKHDAELEAKARDWFHRAGAPAWLARNIVAEWNRRAADPPSDVAIESDAVATEHALRAAWGDGYDGRIAAVREVLSALDDPGLIALLDRSGLTNSEYLIRQLAALAEHRRRG